MLRGEEAAKAHISNASPGLSFSWSFVLRAEKALADAQGESLLKFLGWEEVANFLSYLFSQTYHSTSHQMVALKTSSHKKEMEVAFLWVLDFHNTGLVWLLVLCFYSLAWYWKKMSKFYIKQIELGFLKTTWLFFWLIFFHSIRYFLVTFCFPFRFMKERRGVLRELLRSLLFFLSFYFDVDIFKVFTEFVII